MTDPRVVREERTPRFEGEWETKRLGDILTFLPTANNPRADLNDDGEVQYIHYGDVHAQKKPVLDCNVCALPYIDRGKVGNAAYLEDGDLIIVDASEDLEGTGKSVEVQGISGKGVIAGLHTILCRGNPNLWARGFMAYLQFIPAFKVALTRIATGISVYAISKKEIAGIELALPSVPEQRAIAASLSDVDGLIGALDALIEKKRAIKQAAMQQLLTGKKRLPGFSGECEMRYIGEFTDCTAGGTPSTLNPEYWGGQIRWMSSGELNHKIVLDVEGRITDKGLRNSSTKIIPPRCVLVGLAGQGKTRGTVAMNMVELCTNQSIAAIFPNDTFVPEYLYYNLDARYDELRGMSSGAGGRGGLNLRIIRSIAVPFPSVSEQHAIATILSDMDAEIAALERRREKAEQIKQGIMQQLLTGRIRLPSVGEASDQ